MHCYWLKKTLYIAVPKEFPKIYVCVKKCMYSGLHKLFFIETRNKNIKFLFLKKWSSR